MKLELKHFKPYLLEGVSCSVKGENACFELVGISNNKWLELHEIGRTVTEEYLPSYVFMNLRPLSDLSKQIEHDGKVFVPQEKICHWDDHTFWDSKRLCFYNEEMDWNFDDGVYGLPYWIIETLLEWHFDISDLIKKGLAIDINTI